MNLLQRFRLVEIRRAWKTADQLVRETARRGVGISGFQPTQCRYALEENGNRFFVSRLSAGVTRAIPLGSVSIRERITQMEVIEEVYTLLAREIVPSN